MNEMASIVSNGKPQILTWVDETDKKRMDKLQQKSQDGTISKAENVELCARKTVDALKILTAPQISFAASNKTCAVNNESSTSIDKVAFKDIAQIAARQKKGLDKKLSMKILNLPAEQREIFYQKDKNGNYMLPTKVLNRLARVCYELESTPDGVVLKANDPNHTKYLISKDVITKDSSVNVVKIEKVGSSAALNIYDDGTYFNYVDNIIGAKIEQGKTEDLE